MKKVSIILPTYNGGRFIKKAIKSILAQSFSDYEIIVIDDGSTDNTKEILGEYIKEDKIIYFKKENEGPNIARRLGVARSSAEYIAFLDDDDIWHSKDKLKKQVEFLDKNKEYVMVGTGGFIIGENGQTIMKYKVPEKDEEIRKSILLKNPFIQSSVLIRKEYLEKIYYKENKDCCNSWEDYSLWLEAGLLGKVFNLREEMVFYTYRKGSISTTKKEEVLKRNICLIKKYNNDYPNYKKAFIFNHLKSALYKFFCFIKNEKVKSLINIFLFRIYRKM